MTAKPVVPRASAIRDVDEAQAALAFIDELEEAYRHIAQYPASGSSRYASELDVPGLRSWPLRRYPYVVFYRAQGGHIDVWRVLHGRRDIAAWLRE
ncbi:MAG: type II toxin-antitoxin system RelE/ParE family toxin [Spirochaetaceae bacterium]|nr:type II toxin-antitoxin system RelE/ParE family toxin [Spirochaetaceae bacterium]